MHSSCAKSGTPGVRFGVFAPHSWATSGPFARRNRPFGGGLSAFAEKNPRNWRTPPSDNGAVTSSSERVPAMKPASDVIHLDEFRKRRASKPASIPTALAPPLWSPVCVWVMFSPTAAPPPPPPPPAAWAPGGGGGHGRAPRGPPPRREGGRRLATAPVRRLAH